MKETTTKVRLVILWVLLPLMLVLLAGCGGRAAMGWSAPVLGEEVLYVGSKMGKLYALDINTRQQVWQFPSEGQLAGIYSTPVISGGVLFFGSYEIETTAFLMIFQNQDIRGRAYALDVSNGQEKWHFPVGSAEEVEPFLGGPAVGQGLAYFTSSDHKVYALDMETGVRRWEFETGEEIWGGPAWHDGT
ncbi:MAG: PQQ-binding-like beta-propeller repeat protein, partial [Anaerolineae bacterium]